MRGGVIIRNDIDFSGVQPQAARPFPYVPNEVRDSGGTVVMPPAYRAGTRQRAPVQVVITHAEFRCAGGQRARFVFGLMVLPPIGVAARLETGLDAQRPQKRPFRVGHEVPARTLVLAIRHRAVEIQHVGRVHARKAYPVFVNHGRGIHPDEKLRLLNAVDDERRVRPGQTEIGVHVLNPHFRDAAHVAGMPRVVIQYGHKAARSRFNA